ncbi:TPA: hypothetical protein RQJ64_004411 [Vibrio vulnificus]|nr:hypothetical protein [Vibrio vulnificus]HDY7507417.1 hypothetical protein [Vibrio vulnificus]
MSEILKFSLGIVAFLTLGGLAVGGFKGAKSGFFWGVKAFIAISLLSLVSHWYESNKKSNAQKDAYDNAYNYGFLSTCAYYFEGNERLILVEASQVLARTKDSTDKSGRAEGRNSANIVKCEGSVKMARKVLAK